MPADAPYRILVRDLMVAASIGAFAHERHARQRVRIDVTLEARPDPRQPEDALRRVVSYGDIVEGVRALVADTHYNLAETLADRIARMALADPRTIRVTVRVEKPDVIPGATVGVEIERRRSEGSA
ncbi:dihydroneopterin aldolase [Stella sp.]|uniref:dihydroneopterin aldolase n=1 Tax=Stella sp. TaxID=2912054 RepID=UPI0035AF28D8